MKITGTHTHAHSKNNKRKKKKTRAGSVKLDLTHKDGNFKIKQRHKTLTAEQRVQIKQTRLSKCHQNGHSTAALLCLKSLLCFQESKNKEINLLSNVKLYVNLFFYFFNF